MERKKDIFTGDERQPHNAGIGRDETGLDEREPRVPLRERHEMEIVRADVVWDANGTETRNEYLYGTDRKFSTFGRDGTGITSLYPIIERTGGVGIVHASFTIFERDGNKILTFCDMPTAIHAWVQKQSNKSHIININSSPREKSMTFGTT